jgi:hypothetical protein
MKESGELLYPVKPSDRSPRIGAELLLRMKRIGRTRREVRRTVTRCRDLGESGRR